MSSAEERANRNLLEELLRLRDQQREKRSKGTWLIKGKDLPAETNRQGVMRWYMHPLLDDTVIKSLIVWVQEIPPGSRTGRQKYQGGNVFYVMEGKGHTILDGVKHPWEAGDVVNIPLRTEGVVVQHFNDDPEKPVRFVACEPNLVDPLGVDRGSGFEQLETCPEWKGP